jgi:hypothetical protein
VERRKRKRENMKEKRSKREEYWKIDKKNSIRGLIQ